MGGPPSLSEIRDDPGGEPPQVDLNDRASVVKRLNALYMRLGRLAEKLAVPRPAAGSQRLVAESRAELDAKSRTVADVEAAARGPWG